MESKNTVVLITGCTSGIGEAMANEFHKNGYIVYQTARKLRDLEGKQSKNLRNLKIDVTKEEEIKAAVDTVIKEEGKIDILVNNAGYSHFGPLLEMPIDDIKRLYDVNIHGYLRMIHAVAPHMIKKESGMIINVTSISGLCPSIFAGPYCSSKAAGISLSKILRMELRLFGIKVVDVQPGSVLSKFAETAGKYLEGVEYKYFSKFKKNVQKRIDAGASGGWTSDFLAKSVVDKIKHRNMSDVPDVIKLGPKSFKFPLLAKFASTNLYDKVNYGVVGMKGEVKMGSLVSCKFLINVVVFMILGFLLLKFFFF